MEIESSDDDIGRDLTPDEKELIDVLMLKKTPNRVEENYYTNNNETYNEEQCCSDNSSFRKILYFAITFGFVGMSTQSLYMCMSSQITTIEKRFGLSSTRSSWILSCNDLGFLVSVLAVSHYGSRTHIPRLLGTLAVICGLAGVLVAFPYFAIEMDRIVLVNSTTSHATSEYLCHVKNSSVEDIAQETINSSTGQSLVNLYWVLPFICVCMAVQGIAKSGRVSLSSLYIDNNSNIKTRTGFYLGIVSTLTIMGPILAMTIGGLFGRLAEDLRESELDMNDPRWISAWWLVFVVFGGFTMMTGIPMFFFPKNMKMVVKNCTKKKQTSFRYILALRDLATSLLRILKKPIYTLLLIGVGMGVFGGFAVLSFGPKFYEVQFNIPTWHANVTIGIQMFISMSLGTFAGGTTVSWMKLTRMGCLKMIVVFWSMTVVVPIFYNFLGCDNFRIVGIDSELKIDQTCACSSTDYLPVCSGGNVTYRTPCLAGCTNFSEQIYSGCSHTPDGKATNGLCEGSCNYFYMFVIASFVNHLCGTVCLVPSYVAVLRSVDDKDRGLAMGFTVFCIAIVVMLIPQIYGRVIDSTCRFWKESYGITGACALYDVVDLRFKFALFTVLFNFGGLLFYIIAIFVIRFQTRNGGKVI